MQTTLTREITFGKGTAVIEVSAFRPTEFEGVEMPNLPINISTSIKIVRDGEVVQLAYTATSVVKTVLTASWYEKNGLADDAEFSKVGNVYTNGTETAEAINAAIAEMEVEIAKEFEVETDNMRNHREWVEIAEGTIAQAEAAGVENLKTRAEVNEYLTNYNFVVNEGGEGYLPQLISKEQYDYAVSRLAKLKQSPYYVGRA